MAPVQDLVNSINLNLIEAEAELYKLVSQVIDDNKLDTIQTKQFIQLIGNKWKKIQLN